MRRVNIKAGKRRWDVGIVVDGVTSYGRQIMRGVMRYANLERRWLVREEMRNLQTLPADWPRCDGTVLTGAKLEIYNQIRARSRFIVQCTGSPRDHDTPVVSLDDHAAGAMAARHLLDCQLQHFGFFGTGTYAVGENRASGFVHALNERGYNCDICEVKLSATPSANRNGKRGTSRLALIEWLRNLPKPVGVMAFDDSAAREVAAACLEADIAVPDRVAIIGVNNDDLLCESAWPPLSSVEADFSRVGFLAAQVLDRLFAGEKIPAAQRVVRLPPLGVVSRVSTNVLAVDDADLAEAIRFIREHACDPCTVGDVLRHLPVGRRWLERQFILKLSRSPHDEIVRVRMENAQRLLIREDFAMADVARRCGFSTIPSFNRAFTQLIGTPPGMYRRAARQPR